MLGHAAAAMTLEVYAGLFDGDLDEVAARLDNAAAELVQPGQRQRRPVGGPYSLHQSTPGPRRRGLAILAIRFSKRMRMVIR